MPPHLLILLLPSLTSLPHLSCTFMNGDGPAGDAGLGNCQSCTNIEELALICFILLMFSCRLLTGKPDVSSIILPCFTEPPKLCRQHNGDICPAIAGL
jgi:hypothetical protein